MGQAGWKTVVVVASFSVAACGGAKSSETGVGSDGGGTGGQTGASSSGGGTSSGGTSGGGSSGGAGVHDPWACLSQPSETQSTSPVAVTLTVCDALGAMTTAGSVDGGSDLDLVSCTPVSGASLQACSALDPNCSSPVAAASTTASGIATLTVPGSFAGFFSLSGSQRVSSRFYLGNFGAVTTFDAPIESLSTNALSLLASGVGTTADPNAGDAFFQVYDCDDHSAAGVSFSVSKTTGGETVQFYTGESQLPQTSLKATSSHGLGGIVNVPVGDLEVTATVASSGVVIGKASVVIVANGATYAWFRARGQ